MFVCVFVCVFVFVFVFVLCVFACLCVCVFAFVFVLCMEGRPIDGRICSVWFGLFPGFASVVDKAPFEVVEKGWGEFEAQIKVQFHMTSMKSVSARGLIAFVCVSLFWMVVVGRGELQGF